MIKKKVLYGVCSYCNGSPWVFRADSDHKKNSPFIFPCPMCNPFGKRLPIAVSRKEIDKFIEERKANWTK